MHRQQRRDPICTCTMPHLWRCEGVLQLYNIKMVGCSLHSLNLCVGNPDFLCCSMLQGVAGCCRVLQCVAVCCSVLHCFAVCCKLLRETPTNWKFLKRSRLVWKHKAQALTQTVTFFSKLETPGVCSFKKCKQIRVPVRRKRAIWVHLLYMREFRAGDSGVEVKGV